MKTTSLLLISFSLLIFFSCSAQHHGYSAKELKNLALEAKVPGLSSFVVYENGDTIKGKELITKHNRWNGKNTWLMDGKEIPAIDVSVFQDKYAYYASGGFYTRIYSGKISLYENTTDFTKLADYHDKSTGKLKSIASTGDAGSFFMEKGGRIQLTIYDIVLSLISDNPAALKQFNEDFPPGTKNKNMFVDYHAFLRILKAYDSK